MDYSFNTSVTPLYGMATPLGYHSQAYSPMGTLSPMSRDYAQYGTPPSLGARHSYFDEAIEQPEYSAEQQTGILHHIQDLPPQQVTPEPDSSTNTQNKIHDKRTHYKPNNTEFKKPTRRTSPRMEPTSLAHYVEQDQAPNSTEPVKPKKRGRKPKKQSIRLETEEDDELDVDGLPKDPRRRRILERNRHAATKCRLRKRDEAAALESRERGIAKQNRDLNNEYNTLTKEINGLKSELLRHSRCEDDLIQKYIAHQALHLSLGGMKSSTSFRGDRGFISSRQEAGRGVSIDSSNMKSPDSDGDPAQWPSDSYQNLPRLSNSEEEILSLGLEGYGRISGMNNQMVSFPSQSMKAGHAEGCSCNNSMFNAIESRQGGMEVLMSTSRYQLRN